MEFIDLKTQYHILEPRIRARMDAVLAHGKFIMGPEIAEFETCLAAYTGAKHCLSCSSGTDALLMALLAWGTSAGDAIFVPAASFFASAEMPALLGATPIFVDIDPRTYTICPAALEKAIAAVLARDASIYPLPKVALERPLRPAGIIPVDLFGLTADYPALLKSARAHDLWMLEDAAQAFGARAHGKASCAMGCDIAATSFFPAKPLGGYGDGGAVFTDNDELADKLRSIRVHGKGTDKYDNIRLGINGRLDTLQAAILLAKMEIFEEEILARQKVAAWYSERLKNCGLITPFIPADHRSAYAQYTVRLPDEKHPAQTRARRDALVAALKTRGIPTMIYYPKGLHVQTAFAAQNYRDEDLPVTFHYSGAVLSLPFSPYLNEEDVSTVCTEIKKLL